MVYENQLICSIELHKLCFSPDIISLMKLRSTAWAGYVARMRGGGSAQI
jgi:hypothetical protein